MNYIETTNWLFSQLPAYQQEGKSAYKGNLDNTLALDNYFNHPHKSFKTIHVAGTNGKGSVSHMLASILQEAGYKVGLYTSPHLRDFRERVKINGEMISEEYVIDFVEHNKTYFAELKPSFFEMTVAMAFKYFADSNIDIAVIEVGLGGRLDSTNIIHPLVSIITNISFDHMDLLGDTLEKIATEKAGIIKPHTPVVIGERDSKYDYVFENKAKQLLSEIFFASDNKLPNDKLPECELKGDYQQKNINTVLSTIRTLKTLGIKEKHITQGLAKVISNTGLYGRWQKIQDNPTIICDTAHNEAGIKEITKQLARCKYSKLHIILGMVNDKDVDAVLALLPRDAVYYFCQASIARAMPHELLTSKAQKFELIGQAYSTVELAYNAALQQAQPQDMIYIGGSTFIVADFIIFA